MKQLTSAEITSNHRQCAAQLPVLQFVDLDDDQLPHSSRVDYQVAWA